MNSDISETIKDRELGYQIYSKQERKLTSACRSLYTLAVIIIKSKHTKTDILNGIR